MNNSENIKNTNPSASRDEELEDFKKEEANADKKWEKVKDEVSGVDKTLEKKLENDTVNPKDLENLNG